MPICGLCGSKTERLFRAKIEGAEMTVCSNCANLGNIIEEINLEKPVYDESEEQGDEPYDSNNTIQVIVSNYGSIVKRARESKGWKQEELAKMLAIKESLLHNIESGHFEPNDELIAKLEKYLHVKLTQEIEDKPVKLQHEDSSPMTLGDMIKKKLKK